MGKKPQRNSWPEAKKLCRLNQDDIAMAKRLGFNPQSLIHAIPSPKQQWKLPVKDWIRELHGKRFGHVLGEKRAAHTPVPDRDPGYEGDIVDPSFWESATFSDDDVPF